MNNSELLQIAEFISEYRHDPLGFVKACFPWGEGELENYSGPDEWQTEVLTSIGNGVADLSKVTREAVASGNGIGKANGVTMLLDTPNGERRWGDLKAGDYVFGADGKPTQIIGTRHYDKVPMYRVTFDDDSYCDVSSGHLWNVKNRNDRRVGNDWRTLSTIDILRAGVLRKSGHKPNGEQHWSKQWEIPIQGEVEFPKKEVPLHPYFVGVWIGDGCKQVSSYHKPYPEILEKIRSLGYDANFEKDGGSVYVRNIKPLMTNPIFSCGSHERYIPAEYKYNDVQARRDLLCGLLDTDGEITNNNSIGYSTTSKKLADDVVWMVRSLGGKAQIQPTTKHGWYYKDGERVACRDCYRVTMTLPFNPFTIKHRKERYKEDIEHRYRARWIASIEPIGEMEAMCITVANPNGLYLANDFIVTHNSSLVSWIVLWAISTHEDTRGIITANTETQLRTKTWAELSKWYRLFIGKELFNMSATSIFSNQKGHEKTWRIDAIPWSKDNPEAFAGMHNQGNRILVVFDEASAIFDEIWNVTEGAMTDANTEIVWCAFGNPTRNQGKFYDCFNKQAHIWNCKQVDSRTVKISNKSLINEWLEEYGENSDFFKVHVRGMFPSASDNQLISMDAVRAARERKLEKSQYSFAPVVLGVDPAWTGGDMLAIVLRQGLYSHVLETMPKNDNDMDVARKIARYQDYYNASAVFIDMGYGTGIYSAGKDMGRNDWKIVEFGSKPESNEYANKRAEMWFRMKKWIEEGAQIDDNDGICNELVAPEAFINASGKHQLERKQDMKKRGVASPNMADALALTFAFPVKVGMNTKFKKLRSKKKLPKWGQM